MIKVSPSGKFERMYRDLIRRNPDLKDTVTVGIYRFRKNPHDTRLDNHYLTKRLDGYWAFSITDDIRIIYERMSKTTARFIAIGTHKDVYGIKIFLI